VLLRGCTVTKSVREGVLLAGTFDNAATRMQQDGAANGNAASVKAVEWGKQQAVELQVGCASLSSRSAMHAEINTRNRPVMQATILSSTISHCGTFGISADSGEWDPVLSSCAASGEPSCCCFLSSDSIWWLLASQVHTPS
jgi:hypothetical protein